jgi:CAAX protease family protein
VAAAWPLLVALMAVMPDGGRGETAPAGWSLLEAFAQYALVSVTSQEFLYSSFFFWRYRPLFSPGFLTGFNSVVFAVAHLVYGSWLSVGLAFAGRLVLAGVYRRCESFWGVWILHLLLGVAVFVAGLGGYFQRPFRP